MSVEEDAGTNVQEIPHWHTSHVPKAAPTSKNLQENWQSEQASGKEEKKAEAKNGGEIIAKLKEILRDQKRGCDIRSGWKGFVKMADVLATQPMKN